MSSSFKFQQFVINQEHCAMKVGIDSVILGAWAQTHSAKNILDIGTGTGILSLMLAQKCNAMIDAVEIDEQAYFQAKENFSDSIFTRQLKCHHSDIQSFQSRIKYDIIISNPPYFNEDVHAINNKRDLARHTDKLCFHELLNCISKLLDNNGFFYLILPYSKNQYIKEIAEQNRLFCNKQLIISGKKSKQANRSTFLFSKNRTELKTEYLYIYEENGRYSEAFKKLTQDYYLPTIWEK